MFVFYLWLQKQHLVETRCLPIKIRILFTVYVACKHTHLASFPGLLLRIRGLGTRLMHTHAGLCMQLVKQFSQMEFMHGSWWWNHVLIGHATFLASAHACCMVHKSYSWNMLLVHKIYASWHGDCLRKFFALLQCPYQHIQHAPTVWYAIWLNPSCCILHSYGKGSGFQTHFQLSPFALCMCNLCRRRMHRWEHVHVSHASGSLWCFP